MYKKNGYAGLLVLIIVLAVGMIIYFMYMSAIWGPTLRYTKRQPLRPEDKPWQMENLLIPEDQVVSVPRKGQPELLEPVTLDAPVQRNNAQRGSVELLFKKDCRVAAAWSSQYEHNKKKYRIQSQMKGNVVPEMIYSDPNDNQDKTRLFFIAKGPYTQTTQTVDNLSQTEQGTAYVMGWLGPDNTTQGSITITTDQSWSAVYTFQSSAQKQAAAN